MKDVVIVNKSSPWLNTLAIVILGLLCTGLGYRLAGTPDCLLESVQPASPATAMEKWVAVSIQQAKPGDFVITKDGNVIKLGGSMQKSVSDGNFVYYDTRLTSGGYHKKPLNDMAREVARVVRNDDKHRHNVINLCFYTGARVTTAGPEAWTCNV